MKEIYMEGSEFYQKLETDKWEIKCINTGMMGAFAWVGDYLATLGDAKILYTEWKIYSQRSYMIKKVTSFDLIDFLIKNNINYSFDIPEDW